MIDNSKLLADLEFDMGIVCDVKRCTCQATHIMTVHQIDRCNEKGCNAAGDRSFMFCTKCATSVGTKVAELVDHMRAKLRPEQVLECEICGKRINHLADAVNVERLIPSSV